MKSVMVLIALAAALVFFFNRGAFLLRLVGLGKAEDRFEPVAMRFAMAVKQSILQFAQFRVRVSDYTFAGIIHIMIILGFFVLLPGEVEFILGGLVSGFDFHFLGRPLFQAFVLSQDLCLALVIIALLLALFRRTVLRPPQINYHSTAYVILGLILVLMLTLLGLNALRLTDPSGPHLLSAYGDWMPVSRSFLSVTGISTFHPIWFEILWWVHLAALLFFMNYILKSKHLHVITAIPANFFRVAPPKLIHLPPVDFESEENDENGHLQGGPIFLEAAVRWIFMHGVRQVHGPVPCQPDRQGAFSPVK